MPADGKHSSLITSLEIFVVAIQINFIFFLYSLNEAFRKFVLTGRAFDPVVSNYSKIIKQNSTCEVIR